MKGLIDPDTGRILVGEWELSLANTNELRHLTGYVIQDDGLFPPLTDAGKVSLPARFLKRPSDKIDAHIAELAEVVQLSPNC